MAAQLSLAFTIRYHGIVDAIVIDVGLGLPIPAGDDHSKYSQTAIKTLWDTGATHCAITKETADSLGLVPIGKGEVHHANGTTFENVYALSLWLPNKFMIPFVRATECKNSAGNFGFIVGMDVMKRGDLSISNHNGHTVVSFRMPPMHETDFVPESNHHNKSFASEEAKRQQRNKEKAMRRRQRGR